MSYILTYVRVALATSDAQSILEIPATEKQNNIACRTGVSFCVFQANRGESEASAWRARVACEGRSANLERELRARGGALTSPRTQLALRARLAFAKVPLIRKNHACSAG